MSTIGEILKQNPNLNCAYYFFKGDDKLIDLTQAPSDEELNLTKGLWLFVEEKDLARQFAIQSIFTTKMIGADLETINNGIRADFEKEGLDLIVGPSILGRGLGVFLVKSAPSA